MNGANERHSEPAARPRSGLARLLPFGRTHEPGVTLEGKAPDDDADGFMRLARPGPAPGRRELWKGTA